jgi:ankyrin repeat protein
MKLGSQELLIALGLCKVAPSLTKVAPSLTEGERAFARACEAKDVEALKACMDHYDLRLDGAKGVVGINRVLVAASERCLDEVVEAVLEKDAARRVQAKVGRSVLHEAAAEGHDDLLNALCNVLMHTGFRAIDIDVRDAINGMTPLMHAAAKNHEKTAMLLLSFDADLSLRDKKGRTALAHAVRNKSDDVKLLLSTDLTGLKKVRSWPSGAAMGSSKILHMT